MVHPNEEVNILISFIKNYNLNSIKVKLILLYILNVLDISLTVLLLRTGFFVEANYFMHSIVTSPLRYILIKILLPAILLMFLFIRIKSATQHQLKKSNYCINIIIGVYVFIDLSHVLWLFFIALSCY